MSTFEYDAELWLWRAESGTGSWHFITVPEDIADAIEDSLAGPRRGFGSVKVRVRVGKSTWETSVFPSKEVGSFILPVKKSVRDAQHLEAGTRAHVRLDVLQ